MVAAAVIGAGVLGAGATVFGASQAANAQKSATNAANNTELQMYNQTRADNLPALESRNWALDQLKGLLGSGLASPISVGDVTKDPGYQFGLNQGLGGLQASYTARGMRDSGAALAAASRYGTDYATSKYDDAFNRVVSNRQQQLNPYFTLADKGQVGAGQLSAAGQNYANAVGGNQTALGNALGGGYLYQGNSLANGANQLAGWYQNYARTGNPYSSVGLTGNESTGYTYSSPWSVGPSPG